MIKFIFGMQLNIEACPKYSSLHIFAISPDKHENEVDFLPGDKQFSTK